MKSIKIKRKRHKKNQSVRKRRLKNKKKMKGGQEKGQLRRRRSSEKNIAMPSPSDPTSSNETTPTNQPDDVFRATEQLAKTVASLGKEGAERLFVTLSGKAIDYLKLNLSSDQAPNYDQARQVLTDKLKALNEIAKLMAKDEEVKTIIKETGDLLAELTQEIVTAAKPAVQEATRAVFETAEDIAERTVQQGTTIVTNSLGAALGVIPVLGTVFDVFKILDSASNIVSHNSEKTLSNFEQSIELFNNLIGDSLETTNKLIPDMKGIYKQIQVKNKQISEKINEFNAELQRQNPATIKHKKE